MTLLADLKKGARARIVGHHVPQSEDSQHFLHRMMELGLFEGEEITLLFEGPWGRDPMAVEVRGMVLGLGRSQARWIEVQEL
jgi:Fe2+ transport system protein FeoA